MKELHLVPEGWPLEFRELRPGLFLAKDLVCLRSEYGEDAYIADTGEAWWGGAPSKEERARLVVQPVRAEWREFER